MKKTWKWPLITLLLLLSAALFMTIAIENIYSFRSFRVDIPTQEARILTGKLYIPEIGKNEYPAILISHGANNEYSAMEAYATKLAAAGYAVLLFNPYNHGQSDIAETPSMGTSDALEYLYSLSFVDKDRIGAIGHTMGGYYLSIAAEETGIPLKAVLNIDYVDISGSLERLREHVDNLGFILARFDEHQREGSLEATRNLFSQLYGNGREIQGKGILYENGNKEATLIVENINTSLLPAYGKAMDDAVSFFSRYLFSLPQSANGVNALFQLRSITVLILFALTAVLLCTAFYPNPEEIQEKGPRSFKRLFIPVLSSIAVYAVLPPLYMIGKKLLMPNAIFPETDTNGLVIWAVFTGFILMAVSFLKRKASKAIMSKEMKEDILKAFAIFGILYATVLAVIWLTENNIFILFTSLSPFTTRKALAWLIYLPLFLAGFTGFSLFTSVHTERKLVDYLLFYITGPVVMIALFLLGFPIKGELMFYDHRFALIPIIYMLPFTPLFAFIDYYGQKRSGSIIFPAVLNTLLFSWFFAASNALYILL